MKKFLPLLILVGCSSYEELSDNLKACQVERDTLNVLVAKTDSSSRSCQYELASCYAKKQVIVALPEPSPVLNLRDCVYHNRKTYCAEVKSRGPWVGFDCVQPSLKDGRFYCDSSKCLTITSDESECAL